MGRGEPVLRRRLGGARVDEITADVVSLARRSGPDALRILDAMHLATAVLADADRMVVYDPRLADLARHNCLTAVSLS